MLIVCAGQARIEAELMSGGLSCPSCRGVLGPWGHARERVLRCAAGETHPIRMIYADPTATTFVDTPMLAACPYFRAVIAAFACEVRGVRLMRLTPGSIIKTHTDLDLDIESGAARVHVPVVTNPDVEFLLNGSRVEMKAGQAWYLRLSDPHAVANRGADDRVHLVLDLQVNDWLTGFFDNALAEA